MSDALNYLVEVRPEAMGAYFKFLKKAGDHLDTRTRDLISVITKVAVQTEPGFRQYLTRALRNGASGFLLKDTPPDELIAAIRVIAGGDALLAPSVTTRLIAEFAARPARPNRAPGLADLTERETEVLRQLARGLSNSEMAEVLFVSETTVKSHVSHILTKLGLRDRVQAVVVAYESGLVTPGEQ